MSATGNYFQTYLKRASRPASLLTSSLLTQLLTGALDNLAQADREKGPAPAPPAPRLSFVSLNGYSIS